VNDRGDAEANAAMTLAATAAGIGFGSAGVHLAHGMSVRFGPTRVWCGGRACPCAPASRVLLRALSHSPPFSPCLPPPLPRAQYAISGLNATYVHPGYEALGRPLVPHGISVVLGAPAVFRRTAYTNPARHLEAARILAGENPPVVVALGGGGGGSGLLGAAAAAAAASPDARDAGLRLAEQLQRYMQALGVPNGLGAMGFDRSAVPAMVEATIPQRRVLALAPSEDCSSREALSEMFTESFSIY
jgi:hydroxyacid-oxoacid transhydrogenase